jgi:hypothetical protein
MEPSDPRISSLHRWNSLARENAENAVVASMFEASIKASEPLEAFANWLIIGAAAVGSFVISNGDKVQPLLGKVGLLTCGLLLCLCCIFGVLSKIYGLRCKIGVQANAALKETLSTHFAAHRDQQKEIEENARFWGIVVESGIQLDRIISEYLGPLPLYAKWYVKRQLIGIPATPQGGYYPLIKALQRQGLFALLASFAFIAFLISGFVSIAI